jgi:hypothetical protein
MLSLGFLRFKQSCLAKTTNVNMHSNVSGLHAGLTLGTMDIADRKAEIAVKLQRMSSQ